MQQRDDRLSEAQKKTAADAGISEEEYYKYCVQSDKSWDPTPAEVERCMRVLTKLGVFIAYDEDGHRVDGDGNRIQ